MEEKMDELIDRVVSLTYMQGKAPVSILMRVKGFDKYYVWGNDLVMESMDDYIEQHIFKRKRILFYSIIKKEKEQDMVNRYISENTVPPLKKDIGIG